MSLSGKIFNLNLNKGTCPATSPIVPWYLIMDSQASRLHSSIGQHNISFPGKTPWSYIEAILWDSLTRLGRGHDSNKQAPSCYKCLNQTLCKKKKKKKSLNPFIYQYLRQLSHKVREQMFPHTSPFALLLKLESCMLHIYLKRVTCLSDIKPWVQDFLDLGM